MKSSSQHHLDNDLTPNVLINRIKFNDYIQRFNLPSTESLICAFKCSAKLSIIKPGKVYVFKHFICFSSHVIKSTNIVWELDKIDGVTSHNKNIIIRLTNNDVIKLGNIDNFDYSVSCITQHWNSYCLSNNRPLKNIDVSSTQEKSFEESTESITENGHTKDVELTQNISEKKLATPPSAPKSTYDGFLLSTTFREGVEDDLDCTVQEFFDKFIRNEARDEMESILLEKELTDVDVGVWEPHEKHGNYRKTVATVHLKGIPIGPSSAVAVTKEIYYFEDDNLILCSTNQTPDVPYGDSFQIEFKTIVSPKGTEQCHYCQTYQVHFFKKVMLKGTIEGQATSNGMKDMETMLKKYKEHISGVTANIGDVKFMDENAPEPKLFKQTKLKSLIETKIACSHMKFFDMFVTNESKQTQIQLRNLKGEKDVVIDDWNVGLNDAKRKITSLIPLYTIDGIISTRCLTTQFYQLKKNVLIIGSSINYLDYRDYYIIETRTIIRTETKDTSQLTIQAAISFTKKEKNAKSEKQLLCLFEKEKEIDIHNITSLLLQPKVIVEDEPKHYYNKINNKWTGLSFKEQMLLIQNVIIFGILCVMILNYFKS
ncbi:VASt domain-containing protein [Entamoeba marina]